MVIIGVYIAALVFYCEGEILQKNISSEENLMHARTVAFISLVWSENIRSYTSRSFNRPIWHNMFGNRQMQKAIFLAQVCLYMAVLVPEFSDKILKLDGVGIEWKGWLLALAGPLGCLVLCEACKVITAFQMQKYQRSLAARPTAGAKAEGSQQGVQSESKAKGLPAEATSCPHDDIVEVSV
mmetsp:Transcript_27911/g.74138  ORF Transcript_27911/g.74138 Transcript_27911/m.74138 type:complete len:182 (-) Transcript_27911:370-915(-)